MQANNDNDNRLPAKHTPTDTPHRRVLGDLSPNVHAASSTPAFSRKAPMGSPLKRSFTAAMEGGEGLTYLKRRKLSDDELLSSRQTIATTSIIPTIAEPSPTEPNTPSDNDDSQGSSSERKSFSSLINYDPSSQTTTNFVFKTVSHAELLKLRLRVAMYKVRTNQVYVPFTDLRIENSSRARTKETSEAVEEAVAALRREAQEVSARALRPIPKLLPAPLLRPTAYSSRMIYETNIPSSPPVAASPERLPVSAGGVSTPQREVHQLSSPPDSEERLERPAEQDLTSSVVKGRVAEGLLGLRNAA